MGRDALDKADTKAVSKTATFDHATLITESQYLRLRSRAVRSTSASLRRQRKEGPPSLARLSAREGDVLALVAAGLTTKDLALQLGISVATANYHLANIYRKLGAHSRVAAAVAYVRQHV